MKKDLKSSCQKQTKSRSTTSKTQASKQNQNQSKKSLLDTSNKFSSPLSKRSAKSRAIEALANKKINSKKSSLANATANKSTVDFIGKTNSSESNTNDLDELEEELSDQEINKSFIEDDNEDEDSEKYEENIDISDEEEEDEEELQEKGESRLFRPFKKIRSSAREKSGSSDFSNASARKHANNISNTETASASDLETESKPSEKYRLRKQSNSSNRSLSKLENFPTTSSHTVVPNKKARLSTDLPWNVYSPSEIEKSKWSHLFFNLFLIDF